MKNLIILISIFSVLSIIIDNQVFAVPIEGGSEEDDWFGWAVAAGDFDGDGFDDLAIGVPREDGASALDEFDVGFVNVIYGSATKGLTDQDNIGWNQGASGIVDHKEEDDMFGISLAAGDFNADGVDDLAIGVASEDLQESGGNIEDHGAVHVIYGIKDSGLLDLNNQIWYPGVSGILDSNPDKKGAFGWAVAAGDFNGDGADDLAVSADDEDVEGIRNSGAVNVIYGKQGCGLTATGNQVWDQGILLDSPETDDRFGNEIAAGDFNGDGFDDLAVGTPWEDITISTSGEVINDIGAVNVIYGSSGSGLREAGNQLWNEESLSLDISLQNIGDNFGLSIAAGDFNDDGNYDLAIGVPKFNAEAQSDAGLLRVLYGTIASGLTAAGLDTFSQPEEVEAKDGFGSSLAAGNFANVTGETPSQGDDLAIGVSLEDLDPSSDNDNAGMVNIMLGYSASSSDGIDGISDEGSQIWHQDLVTIIGDAFSHEHFGKSVAAGDFNGDGFDDLAIGTYQDNVSDNIGTRLDAGAVNVIYASPFGTGLTPLGNQWWHQNSDPQ
jgi:hypothetical protein